MTASGFWCRHERWTTRRRDPVTLAELAKGRLRAKIPQLREALQIARFSDASAFMIGQALAQIDMLDTQQAAYVVKIEEAVRPFRASQTTSEDHPCNF